MPKIIVDIDCGNAPKMAQLRDFNIAYAKHDIDSILNFLHEDIQWETVGENIQEGKDAVRAMLENYSETAAIMQMNFIMTHGDVGAVEGLITMKDGKEYRFCDIYKFSGHSKTAIIKEIKSYVVNVK